MRKAHTGFDQALREVGKWALCSPRFLLLSLPLTFICLRRLSASQTIKVARLKFSQRLLLFGWRRYLRNLHLSGVLNLQPSQGFTDSGKKNKKQKKLQKSRRCWLIILWLFCSSLRI